MLQSLLVLIVKNEENDILEWICHHSLIGFEKIVILDNESTDRTAEIIKEASRYFPVEYVLWKDDAHRELSNHKQIAAYMYCLQHYRDSVEWMAFLDVDEFLIPPPNENLKTLLNQMAPYQSFSINWLCFGSSNLETTKNRLILEALTQRDLDTSFVNSHVKTFCRPLFAQKVINPHYIEVKEKGVNLLGQPLQWSEILGVVKHHTIYQGSWRLHHYITRSREHWQRRINRKQVAGNIRGWDQFNQYNQNIILDYSAYPSARKVWKKLKEIGKLYKAVPNIPESYKGPTQISSVILCFLDQITENGQIEGWACNALNNDPITLSIYIDGKEALQVKCNLSRPDVKKTKVDKEFVGFLGKIPFSYRDGKDHVLTIFDQFNKPVDFYNSGKKIKEYTFANSLKPAIIGSIDEPINGNLRGWVSVARDQNHSKFETRCHVLICLGHRPIGTALADEPRHDVAIAHKIDAHCGFSYTIPKELRDGTAKNFRFFLLPDMIELEGSPKFAEFSLNDQYGKIISIASNVNDLSNYLKKPEIDRTLLNEVLEKISKNIEAILPRQNMNLMTYMPWFYRHYQHLQNLRKKSELKYNPLVSIICPVYQPRLEHFQAAIRSVLNQTYQNIEFILYDDGGNDKIIIEEIKKIAIQDNRVRYIINKKNLGIAEATNACLDIANGEWIAFFDHDDVLVDCAIERMLSYDKRDNAKIIYSDEDKIDDDETLSEPMLKPEWDYRYLLGCNYINHLTMVRKGLINKVGRLKSKYNGAQDHDFLLRCIELVKDNEIIHVPEVLYHWRKTSTSTAASASHKPYVIEAGIRAVSDHLKRRYINAKVDSYGKHTLYSVKAEVPEGKSVVIIIPFRDKVHLTRKCIEHIIKHDNKRHKIQIVLINNNSKEEETFTFLKEIEKQDNIEIINYPYQFNYSKINNLAVKSSTSDYIVFMNNDLFIMDDLWLDKMLGEMIIDPKVGAVGGKFLYENRTIQHCGVILGWRGVAGHAFNHESEYYHGYGALAWLPHQVSAVTAACMLVKRHVFEETGGFEEKHLKVAFNDVDLCLKITALGYKIIITPDFVAEHHESISRGLEDTPKKIARFNKEIRYMQKVWSGKLNYDPFYSPLFSRTGEDCRAYYELISYENEKIDYRAKAKNN